MIGIRRGGIGLAVCAIGLALLPAWSRAQQAHSPTTTVKIGLVDSLFRDVPASLIKYVAPPFEKLMLEQTGMVAEVVTAGDAYDVGKLLSDGKVQFAVLHGFEFAWARQKYPDLKPLVIAVNRHRSLKAHLVMRSDNETTDLSGLKGKSVSLPKRSRAHSIVFWERELTKAGISSQSFFGKVINHASMEEAMDDVVRGTVDAVLVDGLALENYEQVKPGCFIRLKNLKESVHFPPGVVAIREGAVDAATLARFRQGVNTAHETARGRELMAMWKLTAFENVPADFERELSEIMSIYPPPR